MIFADILRVCEIKDLIWVMRFQSPLVNVNKNFEINILMVKLTIYTNDSMIKIPHNKGKQGTL